ncbi:PorP/SprF family type IX secretion system membrane protein [Parapedobacter koreensis]|uniref:Type IX secretion system membrane protein, PorP/SprF family n=1 Tax=Parapedobacter koreensis TaxID=332977 RepID=A0A1H7SJT5_9SPHI|nr:PorP/SprF family type IX secretion system membrane protein [Parapedobacter koreensis]SEL72765.1 type IX secretion system membrane protein, PorP/SprF family [Parapedobacter koreensis]
MNKDIKNIVSTVLLIAAGLTANGQQPLTPTHYGQLRTALNPAASLIRMEGEVSFIGRRQWIGVEGAPTVFWGSGYMGIKNLGATAGANIRHESLGVEKLTEASAFFAKSVRISSREFVGLSLNAGVSYLNGRFSQLDPSDPAFRADVMETDALVGFGVVVFRPERYYVGLSLPRLMLSSLGIGRENRYSFRNVYHLTAGAVFALNADFHLRPSLLVTHSESLRPQVEGGVLIFAKKVFGLGMNIRNYGELAGMVQVNVNGFGVGYSYQFNPGSKSLSRGISNTTHELAISYRFGHASGIL